MAHTINKPNGLKTRLYNVLALSLFLLITFGSIAAVAYVLRDLDFKQINKILEVVAVFLAIAGTGLTLVIVPRFLSKNNQNKTLPNVSQNSRINANISGRRKLNRLKGNPLGALTVIDNLLKPLELNIYNHLNKLQNNSIVNLTIGIIGTIISISVLSFVIISENKNITSEIFFMNFLPRISFVIFVQLFAFFFLRLYKGNLEDSKYFQNELTNILAKSIALKLAYKNKNDALISDLIKDLSRVERNFKLAPGESLLNIEKTKIEKEVDVQMLSLARDFFKNQSTSN